MSSLPLRFARHAQSFRVFITVTIIKLANIKNDWRSESLAFRKASSMVQRVNESWGAAPLLKEML